MQTLRLVNLLNLLELEQCNIKSMKNILLTGSEGFIGKNVKEKLETDNYNIVCLDIDFYENASWENKLEDIIKKTDHVLHVGAISDTMLQDANKMMKYNFEYSKKIFDLCHKHRCKVVYSSSAANTGDNGLPSNIYGWSKYLAEQYGNALLDDFIALRYFNVYGPGEENKNKMSSVAYQAWKIKKFELFVGKPRRDFVFIDDVVEATVYPISNSISKGIYEVGSGEARTFEDVLDLMNIKYTYTDKQNIPKGYQFYTKASEEKFMKGWKPNYSLEKGIFEYLKNLNK